MENLNTLINLAMESRRGHNWESAINYLKKAYEVNPSLPSTSELIGDVYSDVKDYSQSIEWYKKSLELDSFQNLVALKLGRLYSKMNNFQDAVALFRNYLCEINNPRYEIQNMSKKDLIRKRFEYTFNQLEREHLTLGSLASNSQYSFDDFLSAIDKFYQIKGIKSPNELQSQALGFLRQNGLTSLVVYAGTGTGKTFSAIFSTLYSYLLFPNKKIVWLVPYKALISQHTRELELLNQAINTLNLQYKVFNQEKDKDESFKDKEIAVMSFEKFWSLLKKNIANLRDLGLIVADEFHILGTEGRGGKLEYIISQALAMRDIRRDDYSYIPIIAMSATISNAEEIAQWLSAKFIEKSVKIKRENLFYDDIRDEKVRDDIFKVDHQSYGSVFDVIRSAYEYIQPYYLPSAIGKHCQTIVITNSKAKAEYYATQFAQIEREKVVMQDLSCENQESSTIGNQLSVISNQLREATENIQLGTLNPKLEARDKYITINDTKANDLMSKFPTIKYGVAYHHAGLSTEERTEIERLFDEGKIHTIFATPTLGTGVDLPADIVIVDGIERFGGFITVSEVKQYLGRAGRPRKNKKVSCGLSIIYEKIKKKKHLKAILKIISPQEEFEKSSAIEIYRKYIRDKYFLGSSEDIEPRIQDSDTFPQILLDLLLRETEDSPKQLSYIADRLSESFYSFKNGNENLESKIKEWIDLFVKVGIIEETMIM